MDERHGVAVAVGHREVTRVAAVLFHDQIGARAHALRIDLRAAFGGEPDELTVEELADAERLVAEKYGNAAWTDEFE